MAIITISRELGSFGTQIADLLHRDTDSRFLDKHTVEQRMRDHGVPPEKLERYDEKKPGFWDRISINADRYLHFLRTAILEIARDGDCVFLGRGAQIVLAQVPGVLRVRVIAPYKTRVARIVKRLEYDERAAVRLIRRSDQDRSGFHQFFFGVDWTSPALYDLVLSTEKLSPETATELIRGAADRLPYAGEDSQTMRILADRCLEQHVRTALIYDLESPLYFLQVKAEDGVVTLRGETSSKDLLEQSTGLATKVVGVKEVRNEILLTPHSPLPFA